MLCPFQCRKGMSVCAETPAGAGRTLSHEGLDVAKEIIAGIRIDFHGDGLAQIQAEDTKDGLRIHHMTACAQIYVVGVAVNDVDKGLNVLRQAQLNVDRLHGVCAPFHSYNGIIHHRVPNCKEIAGIVVGPDPCYNTIYDGARRRTPQGARTKEKDDVSAMKLLIDEVRALAAQFVPDGQCGRPKPYGGGHINDTYLFECGDCGAQYVLQRINKAAFPKPDQVMDNMLRVTDHLRGEIIRRGGDPARETLELRTTRDGGFFAVDRNGDFWRSYRFVADTVSYDRTDDQNILRESGRAFGRFMDMLSGFDAASLHETIENFHNTPLRFRAFRDAVERDLSGRAGGVRGEIDAALAYEPFASRLTDGLASGALPLRVTHNDTKLNNVLIDRHTGRGLCVIDLDTVMPGLCAYDFGDAIRFGASTADEDERDLDQVRLSIPLYRAYAEGYLAEVRDSLTQRELASLPVGAKMMTLECLIRFLGDYLNGDVYFKTDYPEHNLARARTQLKLLAEMDAHWAEMVEIVNELGEGNRKR